MYIAGSIRVFFCVRYNGVVKIVVKQVRRKSGVGRQVHSSLVALSTVFKYAFTLRRHRREIGIFSRMQIP